MSSIHIINRSTKSHSGGGLPFYPSITFPFPDAGAFNISDMLIFSAVNMGFNSALGLWYVPQNKIPTFQLFLDSPTLVRFDYIESLGGGKFTGATFTPSGSPLTITAVKKDGVQYYIYESSDATTLSPTAPVGRYILRLETAASVYYSEEFLVKTCC